MTQVDKVHGYLASRGLYSRMADERVFPATDAVVLIEDGEGREVARVSGEEMARCATPDDALEMIKGKLPPEPPPMFSISGSCMTEVHARPPVYDEVVSHFQIHPATTLFTFGDLLYNPGRGRIPADYIRHEEVHAEQQGHGPKGASRWWVRFLEDPYFRLDQEARAYAVQWDWYSARHPHSRATKLHDLAGLLCSPMYGGMVNREGAKSLIKGFSTQPK